MINSTKLRLTTTVLTAIIGISTLVNPAYAGRKSKKIKFDPNFIPDYTKGEGPILQRERIIGPTGLWGYMFSRKINDGASKLARQFYISQVDDDSPADGKVNAGDVILGTDGKEFTSDARKAMADAINKAEATNGRLSLLIWRKGSVSTVDLALKVLGAYSKTSPYDCPKTDALINELTGYIESLNLKPGAIRVKGSPKPHRIFLPDLYYLGMLATGQDELMPLIRAHAHFTCLDKRREPIKFVVSTEGKRVWKTGYKLIFLSEYYLATGDQHVLPTIEELAVGAARGQSGAGTYGHRFASKTEDGKNHGRLVGYGAINQAGLSLLTGLLMAEKCGIQHEEITQAINRGKLFFDFFVGHSLIPYGDHWGGYNGFDDNGKMGSATIVYDLMGDPAGQGYFSSMVVGSAPTGREAGHCGSYWSRLWGGLGAARAGNDGLAAFFREMRHIQTLERRWNGEILDPGSIGPDKGSIRGDVTGERLLLLSLSRKKLVLTGKDLSVTKPLTGQSLVDTLEGGRLRGDPDLLKSVSEKRIFELLSHELPPVRTMAAMALQAQNLNRVDQLIAMLDSDDKYARYGACNALAKAGFNSEKAVAALIEKIESETDLIFRYYAINALESGKDQDFGLNPVAGPAVPLLLKLAGTPIPNDPRGHLQFLLSESLFYKSRSLIDLYPAEKLDDSQFAAAVKQILKNENGRARSQRHFTRMTPEQLELLWPDLLTATRVKAPSGIMFANGGRSRALTVLAKHRIKEGLDLMMELAQHEKTSGDGMPPWFAEAMVKGLPNYGKDAEPVVAVIEQWPFLKSKRAVGKVDLPKLMIELRKKMESAKKLPLKSIE